VSSRVTPDEAWGATVSGSYVFVPVQAAGVQIIEVFQDSWDLGKNEMQSLVFFETDDEISGVRLIPAQTDSIYWYLSADSGATWDSIPTDAQWHGLTSLGGDLLWRSELFYRSHGTGPSCSSVDIEWKYSFGEIDTVRDVPDDQGGYARVQFSRSGLDIEGSQAAVRSTSYYVHRLVEDPALVARVLQEGEVLDDERSVCTVEDGALQLPYELGGSRAYSLDGRYFFVSDAAATGGFPPGTWEPVGQVPAAQQAQYYCLAPTIADSADVLEYSTYVVSAHTTDPSVYYFSPIDSGYSVDNLPPDAPEELAGDYSYPPSQLLITWSPNTESDLSHYAVHRGMTEGFVPDVGNRIGEPTDTFFVDTSFDPQVDNYYKVSAWDIHGNESPYSLLRPDEITGVAHPPPAPTVTALEQNVPNPFNPYTVIRFSVAEPGWVVLRIFDVAGRPVKTLVEGRRESDRYQVTWEGHDDNGEVVASGVYLYSLEAPGYAETKKMVLLR
jgi:hypothetical protein